MRDEWERREGASEMGAIRSWVFEVPKTSDLKSLPVARFSPVSPVSREFTERGLGWNEDPTPPPRKDRFESAMRHDLCEALGPKRSN